MTATSFALPEIGSTGQYRPLRVGFDLDGVLYDFGASVKKYLTTIGKNYEFHANADEPHTWNFFEHWGMDRHEFAQHCHDGADAGIIFCGGTRPNAVEAVKAVKALGHEIVVITDRTFGTTPKVSERNTLDWWSNNGFPEFDEIYFTPDKTIVPTDIFVEDKLENYEALLAAGTECWLITRAWNTDAHDAAPDDHRKRITDIIEYVPKVIDMSFQSTKN